MKVFQVVVFLTFLLARCEGGGDAANGSTPPDAADSGVKMDGGVPPPEGADVAQGDEGATDSSDDPVPADVPPDTAPPPAYDLTGDWTLTRSCCPGIFTPVTLTMELDGALDGEIDGIDGYHGWLRATDFFLRTDFDYGEGPGYIEYTGTAKNEAEIQGTNEAVFPPQNEKTMATFLLAR